MSVLYLMSNNVHNAVATFGASIAEGQVSLLRHHDHIQIFPDGDKAGIKSTEKLIEGLDSYCKLEVIVPPLDQDAADITDPEAYIAQHTISAFEFTLQRGLDGKSNSGKKLVQPASISRVSPEPYFRLEELLRSIEFTP